MPKTTRDIDGRAVHHDYLFVLTKDHDEYGACGDILLLRHYASNEGDARWITEIIDAGQPTGRILDLSPDKKDHQFFDQLSWPALLEERATGERFVTVYDYKNPDAVTMRSVDYTKRVVEYDGLHAYRAVENGYGLKPVVIVDVYYRTGEHMFERHETRALTAHRRVERTCKELADRLQAAGNVDVRFELSLSTLL